jgi:hypothetical protein
VYFQHKVLLEQLVSLLEDENHEHHN